jgi:hypothetical protein
MDYFEEAKRLTRNHVKKIKEDIKNGKKRKM